MAAAIVGLVLACGVLSPAVSGGVVTPGNGPAAENPPHVEGEVIIKLKGSLAPAERESMLKSLGLTSLRRFDAINADLVRLPPGEDVPQAIERLKHDPAVEYVEPNSLMRAQ